MSQSIRNPYPDQAPTPLCPVRHVCGYVLFADLQGEHAVYYERATTNEYRMSGTYPIHSCPHCDYPLDMDWMRPLYLVKPMPYEMAVRTESRKVCSNCWGQLIMSRCDVPAYDDDGNRIEGSHRLVLCHTCKYETVGYVTQRWVGYAREQDYINYGRCVIGLSEAMEIDEVLPIGFNRVNRVNRPAHVILAELGY